MQSRQASSAAFDPLPPPTWEAEAAKKSPASYSNSRASRSSNGGPARRQQVRSRTKARGSGKFNKISQPAVGQNLSSKLSVNVKDFAPNIVRNFNRKLATTILADFKRNLLETDDTFERVQFYNQGKNRSILFTII